ncbi:DNA starvation/stationary phase protection protein [Clostridium sp. MSTE9]|uniref:Dps family protein n=1 Tax=Clostridium sp. (strain MSTE9) TaxID=1105031 RepID=UPI0024183A1F|nr:DNA starvation/stationary phase protection protein [Clostridium sp. MSTE9]
MHWYVQGSAFFTLHAKFEELYDHTADVIDEVAERLLALGQAPIANLKQALDIATIKELNSAPITSEESIHQLCTDVEYWVRDTKELVALAEEEKDSVTADLFNGYLEHYEKLLWMLRAYQA